MHWNIYLSWTWQIILIVFIFTGILSSVDVLASSLAGGGQVQILANVIDDWHRTQHLQGASMALGILYALVAILLMMLCRYVFRSPSLRRTTDEYSVIPSIERIGIEGFVLVVIVGSAILGHTLLLVGICWGAWPLDQSWQRMWKQPELLTSLSLSVKVALWASVIATLFGTLSAFAKHMRMTFDHQGNLIGVGELILMTPLIIPPILCGVAGGHLQFTAFGHAGSTTSVIIAHIVVYGPLAYFVICGGVGALPKNAYLVARNLGMRRLQYVQRVFLGATWPAIVSAGLLVFAFSMNDSILARYVGGFDKLLGMLIAEKQVSAMDSSFYLVVLVLPLFTLATLLLTMSALSVSKRLLSIP